MAPSREAWQVPEGWLWARATSAHLSPSSSRYLLILLPQWDVLNLICTDNVALSHWEGNLGRGKKQTALIKHQESWRWPLGEVSRSRSLLGRTKGVLHLIIGVNTSQNHSSCTVISFCLNFKSLIQIFIPPPWNILMPHTSPSHPTLSPPCLYCFDVKPSIFLSICLSLRGFPVDPAERGQASTRV